MLEVLTRAYGSCISPKPPTLLAPHTTAHLPASPSVWSCQEHHHHAPELQLPTDPRGRRRSQARAPDISSTLPPDPPRRGVLCLSDGHLNVLSTLSSQLESVRDTVHEREKSVDPEIKAQKVLCMTCLASVQLFAQSLYTACLDTTVRLPPERRKSLNDNQRVECKTNLSTIIFRSGTCCSQN